MNKLRDRIYLWGQTPGAHHEGPYNLPGSNHMDAVAGCDYFGIKNCCRVAMSAGPFPPFDEESAAMDHLDKVVWSIIGAGSVTRNEENFGDLDEVVRQARKHPNVIGGVMDDFLLNERRRDLFTPAKLRELRKRLNDEVGRKMELWTVYYDREMHLSVQDYLDTFDVITFWTWFGYNIPKLQEHLAEVVARTPGKRRMAGCYMWDYGDGKALTPELMTHQLDIYRRGIHDGTLEGIILCSNCIADIGIAEVEQTRRWIEQYGDEEISN